MPDVGYIVLLEHPDGSETVIPETCDVIAGLGEAARVARTRSIKTPAVYSVLRAWKIGGSRSVDVRTVLHGW